MFHREKTMDQYEKMERLSTVRGADRIVVLDQGKIREEGSYQTLMELKGEFYEMERLQMALH